MAKKSYEVEKITAKRLIRDKVEYKVKWKGYSEEESTWEPVSNLKKASLAIKNFEKKLLKCTKPNRSSKKILATSSIEKLTSPIKVK